MAVSEAEVSAATFAGDAALAGAQECMRTLMASLARSRSRAHLGKRAAYRHDRAEKLCTMHVCAVASCELHASAIVCPTLAYGRSEASRRVSGPVDVSASCRKASMQCPLQVTQDP